MKFKKQDIPINYSVTSTFLLSLLILFFLCYLFQPQFNTNDDVVMQMAAHGFGVFEKASSHLVFSNVLWGDLVQAIPTINGVLGYSTATIVTLFFVTWVLIYVIRELSQSYALSFLAIILVMPRAILFPQFTINAGLLTLAAIFTLILHARRGDIFSLWLACMLAFVGYLVRLHEFLLVLAIAIPLLPFREIWNNKNFRLPILLLTLLIIGSEGVNWTSYNSQEWKQFKDDLTVKQPFVNYGAAEYLKKRPDITSRYGYSDNDLDLLSNWFYIDRNLANPKKLNAMVEDLGPISIQTGSLEKAWMSLSSLKKKSTLPLMVALVLFLFLYPRPRYLLAFVLFLSANFYLGLIGRPSILRVYYPLICLLVLAPLITPQQHNLRKYIFTGILLMACIWNFSYLYKEQEKSKNIIKQVQLEIKRLPQEVLFIWGGSFPFESAYPLMRNNVEANSLKLYGLGWNSLAPYSLSTKEESNNGFIKRLLQPDGLLIFADSKYHGKLLERYCQERLGGQFELSSFDKFQSLNLLRVKCIVTSNISLQ